MTLKLTKLLRSMTSVAAFTVLFVSQGFSQDKCGTMVNLAARMAKDPMLEQRMKTIEEQTIARYAQKGQAAFDDVVTIPVVVHIVYSATGGNINNSLVTSQLAVLNEDFRLLNSDKNNAPSVFKALQADIKINFCLASIDPNGNPTTGITRTSTTTPQFSSTDDNVKRTSTGGHDAWPTDKYLNIWVCTLATPLGGVVGYAQFPGGDPSTDGIVVDYRYFGRESNSQGRTGTHEVGHWLNLRHIWGDQPCGNDMVNDTPTQLAENTGCPTHPSSSCLNSGDMYMNYMDYTNGNCQNMFSQGQKTRMRALFEPGGFRTGLITSNGCGTSTPICNIPAGLNSNSITTSSANLSWTSASGANSYNIRYRVVGNTNWINTSSSSTALTISGLSASTNYEFQVESVCSSGNSGYSASSNFTTSSPGVCNIPSGLSASSITVNSATLNWSATSGATNYNVRYKLTSSSNWTSSTSTTNSKAITGLNAGSNYEFQIESICSSGTSGYSASSNFSTPSITVTYCASKGNSVADEWIQSITIGSFTKNSGKNAGYADFTADKINLEKGKSYSFNLTPGFTSAAYAEYWRVWIDYNKDGDFADAGETVYDAGATSTTARTGSFIVPSGNATLETRIRIAMKYNAAPTSCEAFSYGEVEDYTANIIDQTPVSCNAPSNVTSNSVTHSSFNLSWTAVSGASSYEIQYKIASGSTWSTLTSSTNSISISGLSASTSYVYQVRTACGSNFSPYSTQGSVVTAAPPACNAPTGLSSNNITQTSFSLNWSAVSGSSGYEVQYKVAGASSWNTVNVSTNSCNISGLSSATTYVYQVRTVCGASFSSYTSQGTVTTSSPSAGGTATVGTGTTAFANAPYGTYYSDERSQFIITKAELQAAGYTSGSININSLSFNVTTASTQLMNNFTIKLSHTTASEFVTSGGLFGSTNFISTTGATVVYSGNHTALANQWNKHTFSNTFNYNGNDNLLIEICWDNSTYSSNTSVLSSALSVNRTLYYQSDVSSGGNCGNATGTKSTSRPNIKLEYTGTGAKLSSTELNISNESLVNVFPNPTAGQINIAYNLLENTNPEVVLINSVGQTVLSIDLGTQEIGNHLHSLDLNNGTFSHINNGVYVLMFKTKNQSYSSRILIQR